METRIWFISMILFQTFICFFHGIETEIVVQDISY